MSAPPVDEAWLAATLAVLADTHQVPGAQLAIHRDGVTVSVEVGELEHGTGIPVTRETAFPTGSISKAWTATLAMILVADGDLELDATLNEHLPELDDLGGQLTLGQLLSHTSGFASSPDAPELATLSMGRYVREHCRRQDLIFPPGTGFSYSSRNYVLVGHLIETITGMSWWEATESILLRPLGIDAATVVATLRAPSGRPIASGHSVNTTLGRTRPVQQSLAPAEAPAGALAMSADDLVALGLMHIGPGVPQLLPATYAERMRRAVPGANPFGLADGWGAGLAVFRDGITAWVGHDGNANGTSCYLRIDPAGGWVVALTTNANTGSSLWEELRTELRQANLPLGAGRRDMSMRALVAAPTECAGSYSNGPTEYLVAAGDEGVPYLASGDELIGRLAFYDDLDFVLQDPTSGQGLHVGRFMRDPITKQIDQLLLGGRIAQRCRPPGVPEPRPSTDSLNRASA
ncbi:MAG: penicillin-binding protein [Pseudonocardiales bacterium]|nr:MAG: penicillin-binding protein [Pseudonocardiales bacterium]